MKRITYASSLLSFNERVLDQGTPDPDEDYSMDDLKHLLFYNKVFLSNSDEIFRRYDTKDIAGQYVKLLAKMVNNVSIIKELSSEIINWDKPSFESRHMIVSSYTAMPRWVTSYNDTTFEFEDGIYFFLVSSDGRVVIYECPPFDIYNEPLYLGNTFWKTDESIGDYLLNREGGGPHLIQLKVSTYNGKPAKVEFNGKTSFMKLVSPMFGPDVLIVKNPFMYMDDMEQMMDLYVNDAEEDRHMKTIYPMDLMKADQLIEYPNDSFDSYLSFLRAAVNCPSTAEIDITLYRIGNDPSLYYILKDAVNHGILVRVNIELRASGEAINLYWKRELEAIGVNVYTYGCGILKVHAKLTLIRFMNDKCVCQIGTGNYNPSTCTQYTDLSLMTADDDICRQVKKLFHIFSSHNRVYAGDEDTFNDDFIVSRYNARKRITHLIDKEAKKEENGYICIKCNSLDDDEIIAHLDRAAKKGCRICLIVRSACTWIPDEIGRNVIIKSIVWEKLEHSRIYSFGTQDPIVYIGSLDLVTNKLDQRIETMVRIKDPDVMIDICEYINRYIACTTGAWLMQPDGTYLKE